MNDTMETAVPVFCSVSNREMSDVESWLIPSLMLQKKISRIELYLVNYIGTDERIYTGDRQRGIVFISEINKRSACGFGEAHNYAFNTVKPAPYFLIINPDVYLHELCISELLDRIGRDDRYGLVEARQLPYENPKEYDPATGETPWATGCCVMVNSEFFRLSGGFDELFWMYTEDVDLSWRAWLAGYRVIYHTPAVAYHYSGHYFSYNPYRYYTEHFWSARNFLYILYKYWGRPGIKRGMKILRRLEYPPVFIEEAISSCMTAIGKADLRSFKKYRRSVRGYRDRIMVQGFNEYNKKRIGK
jgi:GT2 family glycosyltransferase